MVLLRILKMMRTKSTPPCGQNLECTPLIYFRVHLRPRPHVTKPYLRQQSTVNLKDSPGQNLRVAWIDESRFRKGINPAYLLVCVWFLFAYSEFLTLV